MSANRCVRCRRTVPAVPTGWNGEWKLGILKSVICPDCQSVEENIEAEINEATLSYVSKDGKPASVPKTGRSEDGN